MVGVQKEYPPMNGLGDLQTAGRFGFNNVVSGYTRLMGFEDGLIMYPAIVQQITDKAF